MPIIIKCSSCGYIFGQTTNPNSIHEILKKYGYRCPCCMSLIDKNAKAWKITVKALKTVEKWYVIRKDVIYDGDGKVAKLEEKGIVAIVEKMENGKYSVLSPSASGRLLILDSFEQIYDIITTIARVESYRDIDEEGNIPTAIYEIVRA